ncbi:hypothetical protein QFC22_006518 [Naganishia vaughanmartiniae]|uniref:Uncharacterized protein n=1 Tax=Naganishia vaughanmartiniae TaxID=1424756 RepID=A0ACC2WKZ5_9TREE|nr:hypothetical protein QFC22_006518 [Naganishia vaughanmartiniae]
MGLVAKLSNVAKLKGQKLHPGSDSEVSRSNSINSKIGRVTDKLASVSGFATPTSDSSTSLGEGGLAGALSKHAAKMEKKREEKEDKKKGGEYKVKGGKKQSGRDEESWSALAGPDSTLLTENFGYLPLMQSSKEDRKQEFTDLEDITEDMIGEEITVRARIDHVRAKLAFVVLRYQIYQLSCVVSAKNANQQLHDNHAGPPAADNGQVQSQGATTDSRSGSLLHVDALQHQSYGTSSESSTLVSSLTGVSTPLTSMYDSSSTAADSFRQESIGGEPLVTDVGLAPPLGFDASIALSSENSSRLLAEPSDLLRSNAATPTQHHPSTETAQPHHASAHSQQSNQDLSSRASFVKWIQHLPRESLVTVTGKLQKPANAQGKILEASEGLQCVELVIEKMFVVGRVTETAPFKFTDIQVHDEPAEQEKEQGPKITVRNELNNRVFDLRSPVNQAIFRIRASVCHLFRDYLEQHRFTEIQTAKLQGSATEGGASVFRVEYFGRPAYLAQSPQLAKQMAVIADMGRVYEIGSIFRAENSNTMRHLTEFYGMDLEMPINADYHECMRIIDGVLKHIFKGIQQRNRREIQVVKTRFPHEDLVIPDETVILRYTEGVRLLRESGYRKEDGSEVEDDEDFDTPTEKYLGKLVKEKYNTDYYILDKFPTEVRPFYTMPDPEDKKWSNSFDIFVRGQEILSGGQRIHDSKMLEAKMRASGVEPSVFGEYTQAFKYGAPPHAGGGIGLERLVMLILQLGNIRHASMFPRDPKSFPESDKPPPVVRPKLGRNGTMPSLEDMIASYGDSTNTSWIDPRYTVWRHDKTGAAIGYVLAEHRYAVIWGPPLCPPEDLPRVIHAFLQHFDKERLKPIWCCVDQRTEEFLTRTYRWRGLSCIAEARVDPSHAEGSEDSNVKKKIQQAKNAGVQIVAVDGEMPDQMKVEIEKHIHEWSNNRKGTQMHITDVRPWDDPQHRRYFYAKTDEKIVGLLVLAQLAPEHGQQIKWSLQFPGAPGGTSEYMLSEAMKAAAQTGTPKLTFGASASSAVTPAANVGSSFKILSHAYESIVRTGNLNNKTDFRRKFGIEEDPLYVVYPPHGLGARGIQAIMSSIKDENDKLDKRNAERKRQLAPLKKHHHDDKS